MVEGLLVKGGGFSRNSNNKKWDGGDFHLIFKVLNPGPHGICNSYWYSSYRFEHFFSRVLPQIKLPSHVASISSFIGH